jgi:hypothetical protein
MSGACTQIAKITADADVQRDAIRAVKDSIPIIGTLNKLVDKIGGQNESSQQINSFTSTEIKAIQDSIISNNCKNVTDLSNVNEINQNPDCYKNIVLICQNPITGVTDMKCVKEMAAAMTIKKINQTNKVKATSDCIINAAIQALTQQESSVENIAKLQALQNASGSGASNKTQQAGCSEINTNISDEKYLKAMSECINDVKSKQLNTLKVCGATDVDQTNDVDLMNKCLISAGIISQSSQGSSTKVESGILSEQTAIGLSPMASLASCGSSFICSCVIIIIIVLIPMLMGGGDPMEGLNKLKSLKSSK